MINNFTSINNVGKFINPPRIAGRNFGKVTILFGKNTFGKTTLTRILRSIQKNDPLIVLEKKTLGASDDIEITFRDSAGINYEFKNNVWTENIRDLHFRIFDATFVDENICSGERITDDHHDHLNNLILGETGVAKQVSIDTLTTRINEIATEKTKMRHEFDDRKTGYSLEELLKIETNTPNLDVEISTREVLSTQIVNTTKISTSLSVELNKLDIDFDDHLTKLSEKISVDLTHIQNHLKNFKNRQGSLEFIKSGISNQTSIDEKGFCVLCGHEIGRNEADHFKTFQEFFASRYQVVSSSLKTIKTSLDNLNLESCLNEILNISLSNKINCSLNKENIAELVALFNLVKTSVQSKQQNLEDDFDSKNLTDFAEKIGNLKIEIKSIIANLPDSKDLPKINSELKTLKLEKIKIDSWTAFAKKYSDLEVETTTSQKTRAKLIEELSTEMDTVVSGLLTAINQNLADLRADFQISHLIHKKKIKSSDKSLYSLTINNIELPLVAEHGESCFKNVLSDSDKKILALAFFLASVQQSPAGKIVVFDDPVNSFDNERKRAITKKIGELCPLVEQVIILTHDVGFLREIVWEPNMDSRTFLVINNDATTSNFDNSQDIKDYLEDNHHKRIKRLLEMQTTGVFENNFEAECRKLIEHVFELKYQSELSSAQMSSITGYAQIVFAGDTAKLSDFDRLGRYLHVPLHDGSIPDTGDIDNHTTIEEFFKCLKYI